MGYELLILLMICFAYFLGALPFGVLISSALGVDIMTKGSGNIGATNVGREVGKLPSLIVFVADLLKGFVPAFVGGSALGGTSFSPEWAVACGFVAVLGHSFSPALGFKGGKGVSSSLGVVFAATPVLALIGLGAFVLLMLLTQYVSLSSLVACFSLPIMAVLMKDSVVLVGFYAALALYILVRHRANIARLISRQEPKFRFKKP